MPLPLGGQCSGCCPYTHLAARPTRPRQLFHRTAQGLNATGDQAGRNRRQAQSEVIAGVRRVLKKHVPGFDQHTVAAGDQAEFSGVDPGRGLDPGGIGALGRAGEWLGRAGGAARQGGLRAAA